MIQYLITILYMWLGYFVLINKMVMKIRNAIQ